RRAPRIATRPLIEDQDPAEIRGGRADRLGRLGLLPGLALVPLFRSRTKECHHACAHEWDAEPRADQVGRVSSEADAPAVSCHPREGDRTGVLGAVLEPS